MPPASGGGVVIDGVAFPLVLLIMARIPDEDDGPVRRPGTDFHTEAPGPMDGSPSQSVPQGILDQGLDHESGNLLGAHPFGNGQERPIHRAVHPAEFELDVIPEHGPFPVEGQPSASASLNLVHGQPAEGLQIGQSGFAFSAQKVMHDAVEGVEEEMRVHEVTEGIGLDPRQLASLHQGLLRQPALGPDSGLPMGHFRMPAPLFAAEVIPDRPVEEESMAGQSQDGNEGPRNAGAPLEGGHQDNDHHHHPEGPPSRPGSEEAPASPLPPF